MAAFVSPAPVGTGALCSRSRTSDRAFLTPWVQIPDQLHLHCKHMHWGLILRASGQPEKRSLRKLTEPAPGCPLHLRHLTCLQGMGWELYELSWVYSRKSIFVRWTTFSKTVLLAPTACIRSCRIQMQAEYQRYSGGKEGRKSGGRKVVILRLGG